jgi:two-component system, chemotaxis family, sensor kinase CheA
MSATELDIEEILKSYQAESDEQLSSIEEALVALEQQPDDPEAIQSIFRAAHTLKGNASSLGFPGVAELAHALEDLLDRVRASSLAMSARVVNVLLRAVDALRFLVPEALEGRLERHPAHVELLDEIAAACASIPSRAEAALSGGGGLTGRASGNTLQTLRVDLSRLDRMLELSGEIAVAQGRLAQTLQGFGAEVLEAHRDAQRIFLDLQEEILRARMVPLGPAFRQQMRTVRDAAQAAGKQVRLEISGGDVEVDATLVESLRGPMTHMIRNAIDHGIESPEQRTAAGKDPRGCVRLGARHESGGVVIELSDDGAGLDRNRIADRARRTGFAPNADSMSERDLQRLIFEPGFSTSDTVTELSGRGIGMDVVRRNVEALRGTVDVASVAGKGASFSLRVPLTVAIIQGFLFRIGDETYVIRLDAISECLFMPGEAGHEGEGTGLVDVRNEAVPFIRLRHVFDVPGKAAARENLIVVADGERRVGFVVDELVGESQVVIKPFTATMRDIPGVSGSTILGDGHVALILDVPALLEGARSRS